METKYFIYLFFTTQSLKTKRLSINLKIVWGIAYRYVFTELVLILMSKTKKLCKFILHCGACRLCVLTSSLDEKTGKQKHTYILVGRRVK